MSWARWKAAEKEIAEALGGKRRMRVSYSESIGDIIHPKYSIEVKYGKQIPKILRVRHPMVLQLGLSRYTLEPSYNGLCHCWSYKKIGRNSLKFLEKAFDQAKRYNPTKKPLVCLKPPNYKGFIKVKEY